jgi:Tol biopolymer transport system component
MHRSARTAVLLLAATFIATFVACGDDGAATDPGQRLVVVGRLERGTTVRLVARDGASADSVVSDVTVTPASAGTVNGATVRLLQSGSITVSARAAEGRTLSAMLDVVVPPTVYFDAVVNGNRDIYGVALDGGDLRRWTTAASDDSHPSVAAGTLVFSTTRHGGAELYAISLTSGAEQRLTNTTANETEPALSRSGATIAFVSDAVGAPRVYVAPMPLANPARLTATSVGSGVSLETSPTWSPTADRVAFMSTVNGRANLFIASSAAGSVPAAVAGSGAGQTDVEPAWSPDGNFLAFASTRAGSTQIFLLDLRTGTYRQLTSGTNPAGQPGWLADGRLVFTKFVGSETSLWWVDPNDPSDGPVEVPVPGVGLAGHGAGA